MQLTCPACHARFSIEAALEDEAARELMALLADLNAAVARPLVKYLGLFRSKSRVLGWDRALRAAREVTALTAHEGVLAAALAETVMAMDEKRTLPGWKPLTNHNYLKRVLETAVGREVAQTPVVTEPARPGAQPASKTGQALAALERNKRGR